MRDVVEKLARWWADDRPAALATVVGTYRSAPRQPGASMLVGPDGEAVGSVSGGCVEGAVYELGQQVRDDGRPVLQRYGVSDDDAFAVGLTCGGIIDLFVEKVDRETFPQLGDVAEAIAKEQPVAVATVVSGPPERLGGRLVVWPDRVDGTTGSARLDDARPRRRARACSTRAATRRCTTASTGSAAARASTSSSSRSPRRRG